MPVECTMKKTKLKINFAHCIVGIKPGSPDSESTALPLFQADMLEIVAIKQRFKTSSSIVKMDFYIPWIS